MSLGLEVGHSPGDFVLDEDPAPCPKRGQSPPIFGPCLLWPNGYMDQDATWYGGRPRPRWHCVRYEPSCPPQFSSHFYYGQMAWCLKMPLGMEVGHSPGEFVLDGDPAPSWKSGRRGAEPTANFRPMSVIAKRLDGSRCHLVRM